MTDEAELLRYLRRAFVPGELLWYRAPGETRDRAVIFSHYTARRARVELEAEDGGPPRSIAVAASNLRRREAA